MDKITFENWLEIMRLVILLLSGAAIPIVIFVVGNKLSRIQQLEEKLRNDRIEIYNKILEPFFLIFSTEAVIEGSMRSKKNKKKTGVELAAEKLLTLEYQEYAFRLSLIGSDDVVRAFNNLMQAYYNLGNKEENLDNENNNKGLRLINLMALLLLEVRKSLGNEKTDLHPLEMLEWKINDLRNFKRKGKYPRIRN